MPIAKTPSPLFDTYREFLELNFLQLSEERPMVRDYLASFPAVLQAVEGYLAVRGFLKSYAGNEATYNSYRTHVERLLLWFRAFASPSLPLCQTGFLLQLWQVHTAAGSQPNACGFSD